MVWKSLRHSILLVFANKQDVKGTMTAAQISESLKLTSLKDRQWHIQVMLVVSIQLHNRVVMLRTHWRWVIKYLCVVELTLM